VMSDERQAKLTELVAHSAAFERVGQWPLPDGSRADLYKRRQLSLAVEPIDWTAGQPRAWWPACKRPNRVPWSRPSQARGPGQPRANPLPNQHQPPAKGPARWPAAAPAPRLRPIPSPPPGRGPPTPRATPKAHPKAPSTPQHQPASSPVSSWSSPWSCRGPPMPWPRVAAARLAPPVVRSTLAAPSLHHQAGEPSKRWLGQRSPASLHPHANGLAR
jgi:hypothetical protein